MTKEELAYLAGFIDGEGCISIDKGKKYSGSVVVVITNNKKKIMDLILKWVSKGTIYLQKPTGNQKISYKFRICAKNAITLLEAVYPYLFLKKEQAWIAMEYQKLMNRDPSNYTIENLEKRKELFKQIRILNQGKSDTSILNAEVIQ